MWDKFLCSFSPTVVFFYLGWNTMDAIFTQSLVRPSVLYYSGFCYELLDKSSVPSWTDFGISVALNSCLAVQTENSQLRTRSWYCVCTWSTWAGCSRWCLAQPPEQSLQKGKCAVHSRVICEFDPVWSHWITWEQTDVGTFHQMWSLLSWSGSAPSSQYFNWISFTSRNSWSPIS